MPVSSISTEGLISSKPGAFLWIDILSVSSGIGSPSSIGSPSTLNMRPSTLSPTGTLIESPVAVTSMPLLIPSEPESMMHFTVLLPMCCATSMTSVLPFSSTVRASLILGIWPSSNSTFITDPETCTIRPVIIPLLCYLFLLLRLRAPDEISVISCVIAFCLRWLNSSVSWSSSSLALSLAESMAIILALCSDE